MQQAFKCLMVKDGLICLIDADYAKRLKVDTLKSEDVYVTAFDEGIAIVVKDDFIIPVPDDMVEYIINNPNIVLYSFDPASYIEEPIITISVLRDALIECKGMYSLMKSRSAQG
jgi:hypothetical protein